MKKRLFLILIILLLVILSFIIIKEKKLQINDSHREFVFDSNDSILSGVLIRRMYYGPPGYGEDHENDKQEYVYILQLNQPINVKAAKEDNFNVDAYNICELQLVTTKENINILKKYENKYIELKGSFFSAFSGHHRTDILFNVNGILQ